MDPIMMAAGSSGVITTTAPRTVLFTPTANGLAAYTAYLGTAQRRIRVFAYAATLTVLFDTLIAAFKAGKDVKAVFDASQEAGSAIELPQIKRLKAAGLIPGKHFVVGTSPVAHQIVHAKCTVIDGEYVEDGSWNYSNSADAQVNLQSYSHDPALGAFLEAQFDVLFAWIATHESQANVQLAPPTAPLLP